MNLRDQWANSLWSLSAAVEWIAEHGGDYSDGFLDAAANELLRALQAGEITASGEISDDGRRANIPREEFLIAAPYETFSPSKHPAGPAPMLCWGAYVDCVCDRDWRASSGDTIARPHQVFWQRICVSGADMQALWQPRQPDMLVACQKALKDGITTQNAAFKSIKTAGIKCTRDDFLKVWKTIAGPQKPGPKGPRNNYPKGRDNSG